ncbi:MAG: VOC family protein [Candidatus Heimdallarchaeaceae archaeon]
MNQDFLYPITFLPAKSLNETLQFYSTVLELPVALIQKNCIIFQAGKYGYWGFCEQEEFKVKGTESICLTLVVENEEIVDQYHRLLQGKDAPILTKPQKHKIYPIYSFFLADPNGYHIEIQSFDPRTLPSGHNNYKKL